MRAEDIKPGMRAMSEFAEVEWRMRDWRNAEFLASLAAMVDDSHATQDWHAVTVGMARGYRFRLAELAAERAAEKRLRAARTGQDASEAVGTGRRT